MIERSYQKLLQSSVAQNGPKAGNPTLHPSGTTRLRIADGSTSRVVNPPHLDGCLGSTRTRDDATRRLDAAGYGSRSPERTFFLLRKKK